MARDVNNVLVYKDVAVGFIFQTAKGSVGTPNVFIKEADVAVDVGIDEFMPSGTDGQRFFAKNGHRVVYTYPKATVSGWLSRTMAAVLYESFTGGQPTASASGLSAESGEIASGVITGCRPFAQCDDISSCELTLEVTANAAVWDLKLYKETGKTNLLASQTGIASGAAVSMVAQSNSGLTYTGTLAASPASADYAITVKETEYNWADEVHDAGWFTFGFDTGSKLYKLEGCQVKSFKFTSGGREGVRFEAELHGLSWETPGASSLTASITDNEFLASRDLTLTWDSGSNNLSLPEDGSFSVEGDYTMFEAGPDNAAEPEYFKRDGVDMHCSISMRPADETYTILQEARSGNFDSLGIDFSYGDYGSTIDFADTIADPNVLESVSGKDFGTTALDFRGRSDTTDTTPNLATIKIQWRG